MVRNDLGGYLFPIVGSTFSSLRPQSGGNAVYSGSRVDSADRRPIHNGGRWHQRSADPADDASWNNRVSLFVELHSGAKQRILHIHSAAADRYDRHFLRDGYVPVLCVLGSDAGPDVFPALKMWCRKSPVCCHHILPL